MERIYRNFLLSTCENTETHIKKEADMQKYKEKDTEK